MTLPKLPPSPIRLAELALENGWPAEEVTSVLGTITGPVEAVAEPPFPSSKVSAGSKIVHDVFARVNAKRR